MATRIPFRLPHSVQNDRNGQACEARCERRLATKWLEPWRTHGKRSCLSPTRDRHRPPSGTPTDRSYRRARRKSARSAQGHRRGHWKRVRFETAVDFLHRVWCKAIPISPVVQTTTIDTKGRARVGLTTKSGRIGRRPGAFTTGSPTEPPVSVNRSLHLRATAIRPLSAT